MDGNIYEVVRSEFSFEYGNLKKTSNFSLGLWKDSDKALDFISVRGKSQTEVWVNMGWSVAVDAYRPGIDTDDSPEGRTGVLRYVETVSCEVKKGRQYLTVFELVERYVM